MSDKKDKKSGKIINFINKLKKNKKIITNKDEYNRLDNLAKELVDVYFKSSKESFFSIGYCFYIFIFRVLQKLIANTSFPLYRYWYRTASKEILENYNLWIEEYKNWDGTSIDDKIEGANKPKDESDTIH
jgi:hypothetical protein|tara:strand:- start:54 stop:443 length:390 start_codon:yes stop_codon:yes gene_type:complete